MPPLEPTLDHEIPCPRLIPHPLYETINENLFNPSSTPSQNNKNLSSDRGKEIMVSPTPANSRASSPLNSIGSDLDFLLNQKSLQLKELTIHKPISQPSPQISPKSAINITVRRKTKGGSRHFRGRGEGKGIRNLSLVEVSIIDMTEDRPLRACKVGNSPI